MLYFILYNFHENITKEILHFTKLDTFGNVFAGVTWGKKSVKQIQQQGIKTESESWSVD